MLKNIISKENKEILKKRLESLMWELANFSALLIVAFLANNLTLLNLPPDLVFVLSLILNQVTKTLNKK